jgi:hypothetical protein
MTPEIRNSEVRIDGHCQATLRYTRIFLATVLWQRHFNGNDFLKDKHSTGIFKGGVLYSVLPKS